MARICGAADVRVRACDSDSSYICAQGPGPGWDTIATTASDGHRHRHSRRRYNLQHRERRVRVRARRGPRQARRWHSPPLPHATHMPLQLRTISPPTQTASPQRDISARVAPRATRGRTLSLISLEHAGASYPPSSVAPPRLPHSVRVLVLLSVLLEATHLWSARQRPARAERARSRHQALFRVPPRISQRSAVLHLPCYSTVRANITPLLAYTWPAESRCPRRCHVVPRRPRISPAPGRRI